MENNAGLGIGIHDEYVEAGAEILATAADIFDRCENDYKSQRTSTIRSSDDK